MKVNFGKVIHSIQELQSTIKNDISGPMIIVYYDVGYHSIGFIRVVVM